ncbi:MAG: TlpA family protein disulfide reductase, partial [Pedobacter sp.]
MVMDLVKPMPAAFKQLPSINVLSKSLETAKKTLPGKPAMDFAALDTAGKEVRLSDFKGKTVFLDFWASWCVPCRKENPNVKKLYQQYKDKGLVVLSVSLDNPDKRGAWLKAISDDGIGGFVHISELKGFASQSALLYDVKAIPTNFIIDPQGKFLARNL